MWGGVCLTWVWNATIGDNLCEENAERPDIRLDGEAVVVGCLGSRPLDGEACSHSSLVLILLGGIVTLQRLTFSCSSSLIYFNCYYYILLFSKWFENCVFHEANCKL